MPTPVLKFSKKNQPMNALGHAGPLAKDCLIDKTISFGPASSSEMR